MKEPILPRARAFIRVEKCPNDNSVTLLASEEHRQFYLLQNQSTTNSVLLSSEAAATYGELLAPSTAKLIDIAADSTIYAICTNPVPGSVALVAVEEIIGYSPLMLRIVETLERIESVLEKIKNAQQ